MGHITQVRELLKKELHFTDLKLKADSGPWPIGTECKREQRECASYIHDGRCYSEACPFRQGHNGNGKELKKP